MCKLFRTPPKVSGFGFGAERDLREAALTGVTRTQMMIALDGLPFVTTRGNAMEAANDYEWRMVA